MAGTAIELRKEQVPEQSGAVVVETPVAQAPHEVALARQTHARTAEVAGRVLSLLLDVGRLALQVLEGVGQVSPSSPLRAAASGEKGLAMGPTQGSGGRRRRRYRGAGRVSGRR